MIPSDYSLLGSVTRRIPLAMQAQEFLQHTPYTALRGICCEHHEGVLILRGRVTSYYLKQMAQEFVGRLEGIELIDNRIEVLRF